MESKQRSREALPELERAVENALNTYSNMHRGTGHHSVVSTVLFKRAREIVLDYLNLDQKRYVVIFCTPLHSRLLASRLRPRSYHMLSSEQLNLPLGVRALAVKKRCLPRGNPPPHTGGGVVKYVLKNSLVWADTPDRFEAGTPSIINAIALAKALQLVQGHGRNPFEIQSDRALTASEILVEDELSGYSGERLMIELRKTLIGRDILVATKEGERPYTNLDNASSTPTFSPIWRAVCQTWRQSKKIHQEIVLHVRRICSDFFGAPLNEYEVIFTSNTTEAINIASRGMAGCFRGDYEPVVLNTILEHHSNELPWRYMPGTTLVRIPVDYEGFVDLNKMEQLLKGYNRHHRHGKKRIRLVAVCGASNVLGTINDISAISRISREHGAFVLVDGAQLAAHRKVALKENGIDLFAFSGHKMYAPFGGGGLIAKKGLLSIDPDEWDRIRSSGEENVVGIASLGKAITLLQRIGMETVENQERALTAKVIHALAGVKGVEVFGTTNTNSPRFIHKGSAITFRFKGVPHNLAAKELAEEGGIGTRDGCFCAHLLVKHIAQIHPIRIYIAKILFWIAPRLTKKLLPGLVRLSFGIENDEQDVDYTIRTIEAIAGKPRSRITRILGSSHNGTPFLPSTTQGRHMRKFVRDMVESVYSR